MKVLCSMFVLMLVVTIWIVPAAQAMPRGVMLQAEEAPIPDLPMMRMLPGSGWISGTGLGMSEEAPKPDLPMMRSQFLQSEEAPALDLPMLRYGGMCYICGERGHTAKECISQKS